MCVLCVTWRQHRRRGSTLWYKMRMSQVERTTIHVFTYRTFRGRRYNEAPSDSSVQLVLMTDALYWVLGYCLGWILLFGSGRNPIVVTLSFEPTPRFSLRNSTGEHVPSSLLNCIVWYTTKQYFHCFTMFSAALSARLLILARAVERVRCRRDGRTPSCHGIVRAYTNGRKERGELVLC